MSRILFLHGPSSSGKTTLAKAIRAASPEPWVHLSFDTYRDSGALLPTDYSDWSDRRAKAFDALHQSFAAFANAGFDLIVEHILDTDGWHADLQSRFAGHAVLFIGVYAPEHILTEREAERADRQLGSAVADSRRVHQRLSYDIEVDGSSNARSNAGMVLSAEPSTASGFFVRQT